MSEVTPANTQASMPKRVLHAGAGILMLSLAMSAMAKDIGSNGKVETKQKASKHWFQIGVASWYGEHFQGHKTSTGEAFDMHQLTCAHPSLPMGTWLRVTNMKNKRTTFVRVNDRGPLLGGRIIDLSFAAAQAVGLGGTGKVKLEAVLENDPDLARALVAQFHMPSILPFPAR